MTNNKRWYDYDPTVSLAISILRNSAKKNQALVAEFLIEKSKEQGISVEKIKSEKTNMFSRRWYDFDENVYYSLECLRLSPHEVQKTLAIEIINYLCKLDNAIINDLT